MFKQKERKSYHNRETLPASGAPGAVGASPPTKEATMAKDKTKTITYTTRVLLPNGSFHRFHFRKMKQRDEFTALAQYVHGVTAAEPDPVIYVYEEANTALNTLMNYTNRTVTT
jgi:hypothetical protein